MNDFEGLLPPDYGFKPQGRSAPMASTNPSSTSSRSSGSFTGSYRIGPDSVFGAKINQKSQAFDEFGDIFKKSELRGGGNSSINVDSMTGSASKSSSGIPVFDKPVYDDDIFKGVLGLKSSDGVKYDTIFASKRESGSGRSDDLLAGLGKREDSLKIYGSKNTDFDDLLRGFQSSPSTQRHTKEFDTISRPTINSNKKMGNHFMGNGSTSPHVLSFSGLSTDPLEEINKLGSSGSTKISGQSATNMGLYDDLDPFDSFRKPMPSSSIEKNNRVKDGSFLRADSSTGDSNRYSSRSTGNHSRGITPVNIIRESQQTFSEIPRFSSVTRQSTIQNASSPSYENGNSTEANIHADGMESSNEVWLTVSEIPLFTQPTNAPPPSRPPPPRPARASKVASSSFGSRNGMISSSSSHFTSPEPVRPASRSSAASSVDELEDFAKGRRNNKFNDLADGLSSEDLNMNSVAASSAAAMKEAMERAEVKFRHAKETWKRENSRSSRSRENVQLEKDESVEGVFREKQERLEHEWLEKKKEEEEREHRRLEKDRKLEEKEREQRTLEREMARLAVGKATREARERAAAEARELTEKAAVQRAQAEARERAANEAKEKAERAAAEAREREARKKAAETRMQAERAAVQRAAAEARERAARIAREKAAAAAAAGAASASQQNNANDLDSIFNMGSQAPRTRESAFDAQFQSREGPGAGKTSATAQSSNAKKVSSTANFVDDLTSIFSGAASSRDFQEVEGETKERRRARLERHQRTQERAANALAEKNQRDLQTQREQEERHRIAETLDIEIKRWATGKEGNLRALLSTLQYVLWPECGWQPVSLTDLITAAAVKKVYRKATLCIHPDKVQQKGANLQQKYIAEKIFDLLKEAWNKFNSEELF